VEKYRRDGDCAVLLSALAHVASNDAGEIQTAFCAGAQQLDLAQADLFFPLDECSLTRIDTALNRLNQTSPQCKKRFLQACAYAVASDGKSSFAKRNCSGPLPIL
jgi:hypothetical protein